MKVLPHLLTLLNIKRLMILAPALLLTGCQDASEKVSGSYEATISATTGSGKVLELELGDDQRATLHTDYLNSKDTIVQKGSWERSGRDSLTVYLIDRNGQLTMDTLGLHIKGSQLLLKSRDHGNADITLLRRVR